MKPDTRAFSRVDGLWLLLALATVCTWQVGDSGRSGLAVVIFIFVLALFKGGIVIFDFMELRAAPALWRRLVLGWLAFVSGAILLIFSIGPS